MSTKETNKSTIEKSITYSWDGGYDIVEIKPGVDISYISPENYPCRPNPSRILK